jgi:GT2 family glycosyltransferase
MIRASVIIAVYNDIQALKLIIYALSHQSILDFEIIIAEDGKSLSMAEYVATISHPNVIHTTQPDIGWRKNSSLNNAIRISNSKLLLFIDGDCIPNHYFVESYLKLQAPKTVLCGRRVELGNDISEALRTGNKEMKLFENKYLFHYLNLAKDGVRHFEEGIYSHWLFHLRHQGKSSSLIGCNMGINKEDLLEINGFNEEYVTPSIGEDTDIEWRLQQNGSKFQRVRNQAFVFHLYHSNTYSADNYNTSKILFNRVINNHEIVCQKGIQDFSN